MLFHRPNVRRVDAGDRRKGLLGLTGLLLPVLVSLGFAAGCGRQPESAPSARAFPPAQKPSPQPAHAAPQVGAYPVETSEPVVAAPATLFTNEPAGAAKARKVSATLQARELERTQAEIQRISREINEIEVRARAENPAVKQAYEAAQAARQAYEAKLAEVAGMADLNRTRQDLLDRFSELVQPSSQAATERRP